MTPVIICSCLNVAFVIAYLFTAVNGYVYDKITVRKLFGITFFMGLFSTFIAPYFKNTHTYIIFHCCLYNIYLKNMMMQ